MNIKDLIDFLKDIDSSLTIYNNTVSRLYLQNENIKNINKIFAKYKKQAKIIKEYKEGKYELIEEDDGFKKVVNKKTKKEIKNADNQIIGSYNEDIKKVSELFEWYEIPELLKLREWLLKNIGLGISCLD